MQEFVQEVVLGCLITRTRQRPVISSEGDRNIQNVKGRSNLTRSFFLYSFTRGKPVVRTEILGLP